MKAFLATHFEKVIFAISVVFCAIVVFLNVQDLLTPPEEDVTKKVEDLEFRKRSGGANKATVPPIIEKKDLHQKMLVESALPPRLNVFYHDAPVLPLSRGTHIHAWKKPERDPKTGSWWKECEKCGHRLPAYIRPNPPKNLTVTKVDQGFSVKVSWELPDMEKKDLWGMHLFRKTDDERWADFELIPSRHIDGLLANGIIEKRGESYFVAGGEKKGREVRLSVCSAWFEKGAEDEDLLEYLESGLQKEAFLGKLLYVYVDRSVRPNQSYQYLAVSEGRGGPELEEESKTP